jgi:pyridoxamine 5'-phosphate oxidase family protein
MALDNAAKRYLASQSRGRLATIGSDGVPQNKPVGFTYNAELGTIDIAGFNMDTSAKYRNVAINSNVAFVVDDSVAEGAAGMRFVEIRGQAEQVALEPSPGVGLSPHIIRVHPRRVITMNIDPDHPGFQTLDVGTAPDESEAVRPSLGRDVGAAQRAKQATVDLVEELQAGWDQHDADITDRHFANVILWGSPFGATLQGYEQRGGFRRCVHGTKGCGDPTSPGDVTEVVISHRTCSGGVLQARLGSRQALWVLDERSSSLARRRAARRLFTPSFM